MRHLETMKGRGTITSNTGEQVAVRYELHVYQDALVRKGLEEMRKGRVVSHDEVVNRLKKTGRASRSSSKSSSR